MNGLLDQLAAFMTDHRWLAGPAFALIAFGESLAVLGIFIPATPILFMVGVLMGSGRVDALPVALFGMAGAIAGYWASWQAGRQLGHRVWQARSLARHRRGIARARLFFRRWGGISLVAGRYVLGPFQSMLPLVAGVARMDAHRFHRWNLLSGVLWVTLVLTPGFLVGRGIEIVGLDSRYQDRILAALTAASCLLIVLGLAATLRRRRH
jgi:membrane protein DedA with SNARE-associated domain